MLDPKALGAARTQQRRAWAGVVALVLLGHAALLGGLDAVPIGAGRDDVGSPMTVRTIAAPAQAETAPAEAAPEATAETATAAEPEAVAAVAAPAPVAARRPPRPRPARAAEPSSVVADAAPPASSASSPEPMPTVAAASEPAPVLADATVTTTATMVTPSPSPSEPATLAAATAAATAIAAASAASAAATQPLLAAGEQPPPVYRTTLPAPVTLRYQVRSGFLRGSGEIRWRHGGDGYSLALEARIAGLTLLKLTSEGGIDAAGLAPVRFLDQRARRAPQAANFQREAGTITFSGPKTEWPLLAGSQDQLSWMIQLAAIAAAEPERLVEGGRITMVVVGARGDARVWTLRYAGRENVETAAGTVHAVKLVRDGSAYDRGYEVWLDPAHSYLPAHVTQRNAAGGSELDLLLEAIEPAS